METAAPRCVTATPSTVIPPPATGQTVIVETAYTAYVQTEITLPAGVTWAEVGHFYVKWGQLHLTLTDGRELAFDTNYLEPSEIETKYPDSTRILTPETDAVLAEDPASPPALPVVS